ncbi:MAG: hypothetical protein JW876_11020 [Candidatus Krumholzibacteriota bacterium]|nr:hypothetical protein [Candidatus Krumholzibacteriota bacterium]
MKRTLCMAVAALAAVAVVAGCASRPAPSVYTDEDRALDVASFDFVWEKVRDVHWDPGMGGVDWDAARADLRPLVEGCASRREARSHMRALLGRLGLSHYGIVPGELYARIEREGGDVNPDAEAGLTLRAIDSTAVVTAVRAGSPAEAAGVRPGWLVESIRGRSVGDLLDALAEEYEGQRLRTITASVLGNRLQGGIGDTVVVSFIDGEGLSREMSLPLVPRRGEPFTLGNMPAMRVWIESRRIDGDAGYVTFCNFLDPPRIMKAYNEAMAGFMDAPGLVIDLRGNTGGMADMVVWMCGWLVAERGAYIGTMHLRDTELKLVIPPRAHPYEGPVAVLVDELSVSAAEFMAGGLQALGRARVFGSRTAGAAIPSLFERLPNGDSFQYAYADYVSADGKHLEGSGVVPDEEIALTRESLLWTPDPVLAAALAWIGTQGQEDASGADAGGE